jgi:hypothetical protein
MKVIEKDEKYYLASDIDDRIKKLTEESLKVFKGIDGIIINRLIFSAFFQRETIHG